MYMSGWISSGGGGGSRGLWLLSVHTQILSNHRCILEDDIFPLADIYQYRPTDCSAYSN
jgi:hypothetical protein